MAKTNNRKQYLVTARRWQDSYGNTYFTANVYENSELFFKIPYEYGYGDYYIQAALGELSRRGINLDPRDIASEAIDVGRKCDLDA